MGGEQSKCCRALLRIIIIMYKFQIFRLNFSGDMSEMHNISKKFSKIALNLQYCRLEVALFGQIVAFRTDYDKI